MGTEITNYNPQGSFNITGVLGSGGWLDLYTPIIGSDAVPSSSVPRWMPQEAWRRIKAYEVLERLYASADAPVESQSDMTAVRLGTIAYVVQTMRDLTVGGEQRLSVPGAETEGGDTALKTQQDGLADWAERNKLFPKVQEAERLASLLGDAVYRLRIGRSEGVKDVKVDVIHPSFVFPVYSNDDELAEVALVWEEWKTIRGVDTLVVYKDQYRIGPDGFMYETAGWYLYTQVPQLSDLKLDEFEKTTDGEDINELNTGLKFIPIYHLPNFWTASNFGESDITHVVGIAKELNCTDTDLSAAASLLGIPPMVVAGMKGRIRAGTLQDTDAAKVGPGSVINVDANGGKAEYLDNSNLLKCLLEYYERMEHMLFRNTRLGRLFSGTTDNVRDIESAQAFKTLMASLYARIAQKRTVRKSFYSRLLKGARELFLKIGAKDVMTQDKMLLEFGNVLPSDNSDDLKVVSELWAQGKGPISAETAVRLAQKAGSGVVDCNREAADVTKQVTPPKPSFSLSGKGATPPNTPVTK